MRTRIAALALMISVMGLSALFAQNNRSFVSVSGNDANSCAAGNECRSFSRAIAVTNFGGEIIAISSGGYGSFSIDKSITVMAAPGVAAEITSSYNDGITITAGASGHVVIRGLNFTMSGSYVGIWALSYETLAIDNCTATGGNIGFLTLGSSGSVLTITDTVARNANDGYWISGRATLVRCRAEGNATGLLVRDGSGTDGIVTAVDFVSVGNVHGAYVMSSTAGHNIALNLDRAVISHNTVAGVTAGDSTGGCFVRITNSTVTENSGVGLQQIGASFFGSMKNNFVDGNWGGNTTGTISPLTAN